MKSKDLIKIGLILFSSILITVTANSQNTYPFPATDSVGIGTTSPKALLHVNGNAIVGDGNTSGASALTIKGPNQPVNSLGYQDINYSFTAAGSARIRAYRGASWDTYMQFLTNSYGATGDNPQTAMTIYNNGNIGIGTTNPVGVLDVVGLNANAWSYFRGNAAGKNPATTATVGLMNAWNPSGGQGETQILYGTGSGTAPRLDFGRWNGTAKTIDMSLSNGKVAIGTVNADSIGLDIDTKSEWKNSSYIRLMGSTFQPKLYNLTINKVQTGNGGTSQPTFNFNFDHYQYGTGGFNGTQLSLQWNGTVEVGQTLSIQDANDILVGGTIKPGVYGLVTDGGYKHTIKAANEVRIDAPQLLAKKIKVSIKTEDWADYVFASGYNLRSLTSVENYINKYKHLPGVPSADEVAKNDLDIGATQAILLKKIEELTLYMIEQEKVNKKQEETIQLLKSKVAKSSKQTIK